MTSEEADDILNHIHIYTPVFDMTGYTELDLSEGATEAAYWNSGDQNNHSILTIGADNSKNFVATALMTQEDLPIGSVIEVDAGWQYRPERWITFGEQQQGRPNNTAAQRVVVDKTWWGNYTTRVFNISVADPDLAGGSDLTGRMEEALSHFRIYVPDLRSDQNLITSIAFTTLPAVSCAFGENTIQLELSESADITNIAPAITVSDKATISPDPSIPQDFSQPVKYTVTAENGEQREYTITISMPISTDNEIKSFVLEGVEGDIGEDGVISITLPHDTDLRSLVPTIELGSNATVSPASGVAQNFSRRVTYTVTAQDGSTRKYLVEVQLAPQDTTLSQAQQAAEEALADLQVSNHTTEKDILEAVTAAVDNPTVTVSVSEGLALTPATDEAAGSITGQISLTYDGEEALVEVDLVIAKLDGPDPVIVPGDLDKDGEVTIADVMEACKVMARQI